MKQVALSLVGAGVASAYTVIENELFMHKNIDPIVLPGKYTSHMHSFFGSDAVTATTNSSEELQAGCSTAENPNDYSVYWVPTLYTNDGDEPVAVPFGKFSTYYIDINNAEVAIPQDFKVVAGDAGATAQGDLDEIAGVKWFCEGEDKESSLDDGAFPTSTCSHYLQSLLLFPNCINEDTLESAYSGTHNWIEFGKPENRCPQGMKRMPQLRFSIRYDLREVLPNGWSGEPPLELASGNSYSMHGDFMNGWLPEAAENMLKADKKLSDSIDGFMAVDGPDGAGDAGSQCGASNAKDADPEHGTSDYAESQKMQKEGDVDVAVNAVSVSSAAASTSAPSTSSAAESTSTTATLVSEAPTMAAPTASSASAASISAPAAANPTGSGSCSRRGSRKQKASSASAASVSVSAASVSAAESTSSAAAGSSTAATMVSEAPTMAASTSASSPSASSATGSARAPAAANPTGTIASCSAAGRKARMARRQAAKK